ncbi:hypothetical protein HID58_030358, partial [Brassica napus]
MRDASWLSDAFDEPFGTAVKMLIKLCLESNSYKNLPEVYVLA